MSDEESKIRHLEMIQAVIARLAYNSFLIKGWTVFLGSALYGYALSSDNWVISIIGALAALVFWLLDSYYLHRETIYRKLYDYARSDESSLERFSLNYTEVPVAARPRRLRVFLSFTQSGLHGVVVVVGVVISSVLYC